MQIFSYSIDSKKILGAKIVRTKERDANNINKLTNDGWKVIVIWECEIKGNFENTFENILKVLICLE